MRQGRYRRHNRRCRCSRRLRDSVARHFIRLPVLQSSSRRSHRPSGTQDRHHCGSCEGASGQASHFLTASCTMTRSSDSVAGSFIASSASARHFALSASSAALFATSSGFSVSRICVAVIGFSSHRPVTTHGQVTPLRVYSGGNERRLTMRCSEPFRASWPVLPTTFAPSPPSPAHGPRRAPRSLSLGSLAGLAPSRSNTRK